MLPGAAARAEGIPYVHNFAEAPETEAWTPCAPASKGHAECEVIVAPKPTVVPGLEYQGSGELGGLDPKDLRSAYNLPSTGGAGSTIAVIDGPADPNAEADLAVYRKTYGLPECTEANGCFKQVNEHGEPHKPTSSGGWNVETSLDLDMVSAACQECHVTLIEAANEETGLLEAQKAAAKLGVTAVSNSWNLGFEAHNPANPSRCETEPESCITQKAEETDDAYFNQPGLAIFFAGGDYGYAVRYPTVSKYVISVGGTTLYKESKSARGWVEKVWSHPEYGKDEKGRGSGSGCSEYEAQPKWQGFIKACMKRLENDVAGDADWVASPVSLYDTYIGGWDDNGGTSASSPFVAGVWGLYSSTTRSLGADAFYRGANSLYDITEGSDGTCTPPAEDALFCTAEIGYDGPSGNGTPDGIIKIGPSVTGVSPESGPEAGGTSVTITGTQLKGAKSVKFGSVEAKSFTVNSETSIKATSPAQAAGTVDVTVTTPEGTSPTSPADHFTYLPKPTVTNVQPDVGVASGGTTTMISGTSFNGATAVKFGSTGAASFTVISETWIKAVSPAGSGTVDVTVTTPNGTSTSSSSDHFTYRSGGIAVGWGDNGVGELGDGTTSGPETCEGASCSRIPVAVSGPLDTAAAVSAGVDHSLALQSAGTIMAWGENFEGELGNGTTTSSDVPVKVSGISEASAVSAGDEFSLAQLKGGTVKAWGYNGYGQLGNGTTTSSDTPVTVSGITEAVAVAAGETHSLALLKNGTVMAWGNNSAGELGNGTTTSSDVPVKVSGITEAVAISAGAEFSLAVLKNGTVQAWGYNGSGQLGDGGTTSSDVPVAVSSLSEVVSVAAGAAHSLALLKSGSVKSWGANQSGQLGYGSCCSFSDVPGKVSGLTEATALAAGYHSLALLKSGVVMDWGRNSDGQLGDGTSTGPETCEPVEEATRACSKVPIAVSNLSDAIAIDGGVNYALAVGTIPTDYKQAIDSPNSLNAVSCVPGSKDCVASDSQGKAFYTLSASAAGSATWKTWNGPGTKPSEALDCPSGSLCLMADGREEGKDGNLYYATSLGGAWTEAYSPVYGVDAISCVSSSFCVDGQNGEGYFRYSTSPASSSWTLELQGSASMNAVHCLSSSFCAIADSVGDVHIANSTSQIESSSWKSTNVDSVALNGIACTSTSSCVAVNGSGEVLNLAISSEGAATATKDDIDGTNDLTAVTCTGSTCVAVDSAGNVFASANSGTSWTKVFATGDKLTSVSCAGSSLCAAADTTGNLVTFEP